MEATDIIRNENEIQIDARSLIDNWLTEDTAKEKIVERKPFAWMEPSDNLTDSTKQELDSIRQ